MPKACERCGAENQIQAAVCDQCAGAFGKKNEMSPGTAWAILVAVLLVVAWIAWSASTNDDSDSTTSSPNDSGAVLACMDFREAMSDGAAGVLTDAELRDRFKDIYNDAIVSDTPGVTAAAKAMLAGATNDDVAQVRTGMTAMDDACTNAGM